MQGLIETLNKRRKIAMLVVGVFALTSMIVSWNLHVNRSTYFEAGRYNDIFIAALVIYKFFELLLLYYWLFYRHYVSIRSAPPLVDYALKIAKQTKMLFFLIPQGNTIFGIIAYKLSGNVLYFLMFMSIALLALLIIKPNILNITTNK